MSMKLQAMRSARISIGFSGSEFMLQHKQFLNERLQTNLIDLSLQSVKHQGP
jgi:hypothetical protein